MIYLGSAGQEAAIEALCRQHLSKKATRAWMRTNYHPEDMLYASTDGKLCAFLQLQQRTFVLSGRKYRIFLLSLGLQSADAPAGIMQQLIAQALEIARKSGLFAAMETSHPEKLQALGFQPWSAQSACWMEEAPWRSKEYVITPWSEQDLYPVYRKFMQLFDGSVLLDDRQFAASLSSALIAGKELYVLEKQGKPHGFAIVTPGPLSPSMDTAVYQDLNALEAMMAEVYHRYGPFWLHLSDGEPQSYLQKEGWKPEKTFCLQACDSEASQRFFENAALSASTSKPAWNLLP